MNNSSGKALIKLVEVSSDAFENNDLMKMYYVNLRKIGLMDSLPGHSLLGIDGNIHVE